MLLRLLARPALLWPAAALTLALHVAIHFARRLTGGDLLDFRLTGAGARALLDTLASRPGAIEAHIRITALLDTAYPLAYGVLVAGLCARYATARPGIAAAPALLAAACDLAENAVQLLALTGAADLLAAKTLLTPLKFALIAPASALAIWLWARAVLAGQGRTDLPGEDDNGRGQPD